MSHHTIPVLCIELGEATEVTYSDAMENGHVVGDRYRLGSVLGRGGFGVVFEAEDLENGEKRAVKMMRPPPSNDLTPLRRFEREVEIVDSIQHPGIVKIYDSGALDDDILYYVMELLEGQDLSQALEVGPLPLRDAVEVACELLEALAAAHDANVVHRDIKPANIFLSESDDAHVRLLDFGIARAVGGDDGVTKTGLIVGTPRYMPPESALEGDYQKSSDLYSLGLVFLEMLTGRPAFDGSATDVLVAQITRDPAFPPELGESRLAWWLTKMIAKDPSARYVDAGRALEALRKVWSDQSLRSLRLDAPPRDEAISWGTEGVILTAEDRQTISELVRMEASFDELADTVSDLVVFDSLWEKGWRDTWSDVETHRRIVVDELDVAAAEIGSADPYEAETEPVHHDAFEPGELVLPGALERDPFGDGVDTQAETIPRVAREDEIAALVQEEPRRAERPTSPWSSLFLASAVITLTFVALALIQKESAPERSAELSPTRWVMRVESEPADASIMVNGQLRGQTPRAIEVRESDFPAVFEFRRADGARLSKLLDQPVDLLRVEIPDPPEREDTWKPIVVPDEEQDPPRRSSRRSRVDYDELFGDRVVNKEVVLEGKYGPYIASTTNLNGEALPTRLPLGSWWSEVHMKLTETAFEACSDLKDDDPETIAKSKPRMLLVRINVTANGLLRQVDVGAIPGGQEPPRRISECVERALLGKFVMRPGDGKSRIESIPVGL